MILKFDFRNISFLRSGVKFSKFSKVSKFSFNFKNVSRNYSSLYLLENSSFNGWASLTNYERKLFIPHLHDRLGLLESISLTSESCSLVFRGKLYVYGPG